MKRIMLPLLLIVGFLALDLIMLSNTIRHYQNVMHEIEAGTPVTVHALHADRNDEPLAFDAKYRRMDLLHWNIGPQLHANAGDQLIIRCPPPLNNHDDVVNCLTGINFDIQHPQAIEWNGGTKITIIESGEGWRVILRRYSDPHVHQLTIDDLTLHTPSPNP